jgi:hypothetical protein
VAEGNRLAAWRNKSVHRVRAEDSSSAAAEHAKRTGYMRGRTTAFLTRRSQVLTSIHPGATSVAAYLVLQRHLGRWPEAQRPVSTSKNARTLLRQCGTSALAEKVAACARAKMDTWPWLDDTAP